MSEQTVQYTIYIGLNDAEDGVQKFETKTYLDILKNVCAPFFTDHVILLQDYDRCMAFGCVFGKGFDPIMVTGYAKFID